MEKTKKILKIILTLLLFIFIAALCFRMCQASHEALDGLYVTDAFISAYSQSNDVRTHAVNDQFSENGSVYAYSLIYIDEAGYLQISVRYNNRHIDDVIASYPELKYDDIYYVLEDENGSTYTPSVLDSASKYNYTYFKLEFTGVSFENTDLKIKMVLGDIDINVGDMSTLTIHRKDDTYIPYDFSKKEQALLPNN